MRAFRNISNMVFALVMGVSVSLWSVVPASSHASVIAETIQDHVEMIETHGHAHGNLAEDIYWAMHGHSHEAADHDHSPAVLTLARRGSVIEPTRDIWRLRATPPGPSRSFRIERPPRV